MEILFVVALLLAWPTLGLSIVAWIGLFFIKAKGNTNKLEKREKVKETIEPLFQGRFSDFFLALDMPIYECAEISDAEAHQCGRHIMNYIAHNPTETTLFINGLQKWKTKGDLNLCDPITAAKNEHNYDAKGDIHMVCYRAVEALMTNNKLKCFEKVDVSRVIKRKVVVEVDSLKIGNLNHRNNEAPISLSQMDEDKIEMDIVRFIRDGGEIEYIPRYILDTDYEKLKFYAISKGGIINYNDSVSVRLIILDKLYRLKFDKAENNSIQFFAKIIDEPLKSTHGIHAISYGKNYKLDKKSFETCHPLSNESGINKDGREDEESYLTPEDFVSAHYDMNKFFLTSTLRYRSVRPEWAYYEDELKAFQRGILVKSSSLGVDDYFSTRFLDDEVGLNYMMSYIHSAEANGYDTRFLNEVGSCVIKKIWDQPDERGKFLEKWSSSEKVLPTG